MLTLYYYAVNLKEPAKTLRNKKIIYVIISQHSKIDQPCYKRFANVDFKKFILQHTVYW